MAAPSAPTAEAPAQSSLDRSFVHSIAWTGAAKWLGQGLTWASTFIVAGLLSPDDYGLVGMAGVYLGLVTLLSEFGVGLTVITLRDLAEEHIAQLNGLAVVLGVFSFAVSCLAAVPLGWFFHAPRLPLIVVIMSIGFVITAVRVVPGALLQRELKFKQLALIESAQALVVAPISMLFAWQGFGYWTLVVGGMLGLVIQTGLTLAIRRHNFAWPRPATFPQAMAFTRHQVVTNVAWYTYSNADFIVAGRVLGQAQLGVYTLAWTLARTLPEKITSLVVRVTPAFFSAVQDDTAALRRYLLRLSETLALVSFPALAGLALVADDVAKLLGEQWQGMVLPLRLLALFSAYEAIMQLLLRVLTATRETRFVMAEAVTLALLMPPAFWVGSYWGPAGIAAAWLVVHPITRWPVLRRVAHRLQLSLWDYFMAFWPALSATAIMTVALWVLEQQVVYDWSPLMRLLTSVASGASMYVLALWLFHHERVIAVLRILRQARG